MIIARGIPWLFLYKRWLAVWQQALLSFNFHQAFPLNVQQNPIAFDALLSSLSLSQ